MPLRMTSLLIVVVALGVHAGCSSGHDGCRPNPSITADMSALSLPSPDGGKLCHAEAKFVMYEVMKDRMALVQESTGKFEKAGWKEIANPASGQSDDPSSLFYEKNGKQIMFSVSKCGRSSFNDMFDSCSIATYSDVTKSTK